MPSFAYASHLAPNKQPIAPPAPKMNYSSHLAPARPTTPAPGGRAGAYASHLAGARSKAGASAAKSGTGYAQALAPPAPNPFAGMY